MDVTKEAINVDDEDNGSLELEELQLTAELEKEEAEMVKNGEVEDPKDEVEASEKMDDLTEDQRAHLSHLNAGRYERSRKTTEVSEMEYHNRAN